MGRLAYQPSPRDRGFRRDGLGGRHSGQRRPFVGRPHPDSAAPGNRFHRAPPLEAATHVLPVGGPRELRARDHDHPVRPLWRPCEPAARARLQRGCPHHFVPRSRSASGPLGIPARSSRSSRAEPRRRDPQHSRLRGHRHRLIERRSDCGRISCLPERDRTSAERRSGVRYSNGRQRLHAGFEFSILSDRDQRDRIRCDEDHDFERG